MENAAHRLLEIHYWTLVRLSYVLKDCVVTICAATGNAHYRPGIEDGSLFVTTGIESMGAGHRQLTTRNTTYSLCGPPVLFEDWDESRYDKVWSIANYPSRLLSQLEGITQIPTTFSEMIQDPTFFAVHQTQRLLLNAIDTADDIDNGLGKTATVPDISQLAALANIAKRTESIDRAVAFAYQMRPVMLEEFGGTKSTDCYLAFPQALMLTIDDVPQIPVRLIPIAEAAGEIVAYLPSKLGPWARCAWFVARNPNLLDFEKPIEAIQNGRIKEVVRAARIFPRLGPVTN